MTAEMRIPLHDLREITNGFSVDSRIGKGGYGDVYKGVYNGRVVAVKLLHVDTVQGIDDQQYINEVGNLSRAKHPNIIQLLGYSYETTSELVEHNSKQRLSQHIYRALCFEYLQGGSLDVRLREKSLAPDWSTRYNIIKGICEGLNFLHGCKPAIFHLDLKPANILLDNAMVPKVADFGLSRVISQSHTQVTKQIRGTQAYMPPEFINGGNISHKNDVFSLGLVMVEIMTGSLGYSNSIEMDEVVQFKQKVHTNWKNRIKATSEYPLEELHQVQTCIDIAMRCLEPDRNNRPTIAEVLDILNKTETHIPKGQLADVLPCPIIGPNNTMANTLKEMAAELDNITNQNRHSSYMPENSSNVQQVTDIRETTSDVEKELIIGRTEEIQEIVATLCGSTTPENKIAILPIYGMGVFPKGHNIVKYDLIHQWIALGFIEQSNTFDSMQLCEKYVRQLLGMSFLQYAKTQPSSGRNQDKHAISFTMHDLVHDLAKEILSHQLNTGGNKCRYASLTDCSNSLQFPVNFPANIKALRFQDCGGRELCGGAFSSAKCLRVLDLSECLIKKLPDCIGQLKPLRFLHAPDIHNFEIPNCITKLSELNYLNLRCSRYISALPESIGDMKGLMHLDLSGCHQIRELPVSFSELKQLVHLDLSGCNMFLAEALGGCTKLQYLNLSVVFPRVHKRTTGLPEVIGNLIKLRYLNLSGCVDLMGPRPLRGQDPDWVEEIHRLLCSISTFSNLEHLVLSCNDQISSIPESFGNLTKLHTLDLTRCRFVRKLPDSIFKMVSLKVLIDSSIRLGESTLPRFNFISLPHFEVQSSSDKCSSNIILLQLTNPDELEIDKLENVKSAEEAMSVKLIEKLEITSLAFQWTLGAERFADDKVVLEKLVPPGSVWHLSITGYMSHSIPDWFMDIRQYVPTLVRIFLCYFPNCNNLPPLGQLPNLNELNLSRMEGSEEWNTTHYSGKEGSNELMFPKLVDLKIKQCPKRRIKPCLPRAIFLSIEDSDNMLSSWGESSTHIRDSSSSPVTELTVKDSKVPMHQWRLLYHLPALRALSIVNCSDLSTSPDMTQHLSSIDLQQVELYGLDQAELPNWLAKLTSLDKLILSCCESMRSLPQWLRELTSLKEIDVGDCRQLEKWWASKENRRFIAHIDVTVEGFPSDSDEEDISNESSVLGEASDESNEETDEETTNSQDSESGSNQRKRPRYDGVNNPSSLPPTWLAPTIPRSRASDIITQEMSCHPPPSPVARDMMPSMPTAIAINAPALSVVVISDDDADDMNLSIICTSDDDRPTVKAPARPARLTPCRPARPTPCSPLGLLIASSPATPCSATELKSTLFPGQAAPTLTSSPGQATSSLTPRTTPMTKGPCWPLPPAAGPACSVQGRGRQSRMIRISTTSMTCRSSATR